MSPIIQMPASVGSSGTNPTDNYVAAKGRWIKTSDDGAGTQAVGFAIMGHITDSSFTTGTTYGEYSLAINILFKRPKGVAYGSPSNVLPVHPDKPLKFNDQQVSLTPYASRTYSSTGREDQDREALMKAEMLKKDLQILSTNPTSLSVTDRLIQMEKKLGIFQERAHDNAEIMEIVETNPQPPEIVAKAII